MSIGDLHNWYSAAGSEIEIGWTGQISDQQDGLRYPAFYRAQDNQAAKGLWLGATNFYDPIVNLSRLLLIAHSILYRNSNVCIAFNFILYRTFI